MGIRHGRAGRAIGEVAGTPLMIALLRAVVLAAIVGALIMFGLPAVLALGAAAAP
jgi:hypothetical protein